MPHALAYEEGVRVLLQGGLLRATKQGLYNVLALATMDRFDTYLSLASCLGMLAWYAERFPAVCAGLAAEHVAVSRKRALRKQQQDTPAATLFLLPTLQPAAGSSSVSASAVEWTHTGMQESLWELLQRMPAETAALGVDPRLLPGMHIVWHMIVLHLHIHVSMQASATGLHPQAACILVHALSCKLVGVVSWAWSGNAAAVCGRTYLMCCNR